MTTSRSQDTPAGKQGLLIGVVGVCGAGKSTLIKGLEQRGYRTRHIAQEHSYVKDMWKRITNPDVLIFLDASYAASTARRRLDWTPADHAEQQRRLSHAREHADLYVDTESLLPGQVLELVIAFVGGFSG